MTLGADETKVLEVEAEPVMAFVRQATDTEQQSIVLRPEPQTNDAKGKTSQFVAKTSAPVLENVKMVVSGAQAGEIYPKPDDLPDLFAGGQMVALELARAARARGDEVLFFSPARGPFTELVEREGMRVLPVAIARVTRLRGAVRLAGALRREHVSVLHTHTAISANARS